MGGKNNSLKRRNKMVTTFTTEFLKDPFFNMGLNTLNATKPSYPPYNVVKVDDDHLVMEFAVAGFKKDEISVTTEKNVLTIKSTKDDADEKDYLHKGIAARKFTRSFTLPEYFEVDSASVDNGILYIDLVRNIPEEKKPKTIKIK
jgi:molecular chaperone IbpA